VAGKAAIREVVSRASAAVEDLGRPGDRIGAVVETIAQVQSGTRGAVHAMTLGAERVEQGSLKADLAGTALAKILEAVDSTVGQVGAIASAAHEVSVGARSVTKAMDSISAVVEEKYRLDTGDEEPGETCRQRHRTHRRRRPRPEHCDRRSELVCWADAVAGGGHGRAGSRAGRYG
jgi:methyl-accepting chemotaxis protein